MKNQSLINRRRFLQLSAISGAASLIPVSADAAVTPLQPSTMPYRALGKTGLSLSVFSLGPIRGNSAAMIKAAFRAGVNHFDSGHAYREGQTDLLLGGMIKRGDLPRDKVVLSTKVKMHDNVPDDTYEEVFRQRFDQSLERLGVPFVDLFYYHEALTTAEVVDPRIHKLLLEAKQSGKTRFIGISIHGYEPDMLQAVIDAKIYDVVMMYYNYKQKDSDLIKQRVEQAAQAGIGILAMKVMAGAKGVDGASAMKWALQNKHITTALMGCGSFDEYEADLDAALNLEMTLEDKQRLDLACGNDDIYCQQCQQCKSQCPRHLPIPEIMRSYMYLYGYNEPLEAKKVLDELAIFNSPCDSCAQCTIQCTAGFDIAQKISKVTRLQQTPVEFLT